MENVLGTSRCVCMLFKSWNIEVKNEIYQKIRHSQSSVETAFTPSEPTAI